MWPQTVVLSPPDHSIIPVCRGWDQGDNGDVPNPDNAASRLEAAYTQKGSEESMHISKVSALC